MLPQFLPMLTFERRCQPHRATAIGLMTSTAMGFKQGLAWSLSPAKLTPASQQQPSQALWVLQATPTMMEVVQWNIELVLAMHQLMSL